MQTTENDSNLRVMKQLVRSVGHALRSPLSAIFQTAHIMTDDSSLNSAAIANVNEISSSTTQLLTTADKIIRLIQVMNCASDGTPRISVRLSEAAGRAYDSSQKLLTESGCVVVVDIPHNLPEVAFTSGIALQQLIQTVLANVVKRAVNPIIYLSGRAEHNAVVVSVGNTQVPETERTLSIDEFLNLQRDDMLALDVFTSYCLLQKEGGSLWITSKDNLENICWNFSLLLT